MEIMNWLSQRYTTMIQKLILVTCQDPISVCLERTGKYEEPILAIIHEKLGLREPAYYHERIKECDNAVLRTEVEQIASRPSDRFQWFESTNLGDFERWEGRILGVNPRSAMEMYRARDRELRRL
jgi:hypothetical protein